ncbi:unnamed protein product [Polarella glacialis]|nr:unnamed protein product [Polarella glacialis]
MAQDQKRCIPPHVADAITAHVGDNDLMTRPELRTRAMEARKGHDKLWAPFFEEVLKPLADRGDMKASLRANEVRRHFQDVSDLCLLDLCKRREVAIKTTGSGLHQVWEFSW